MIEISYEKTLLRGAISARNDPYGVEMLANSNNNNNNKVLQKKSNMF